MGRTCTRCFVRFPGRRGLALLWCKTDRFYVCRRCWERGCGWGHGLGIKGVREGRTSGKLGGLVLLTILLTPTLGYFVYDGTVLRAWHVDTPVPIASLTPGKMVKVSGILGSDGLVALGGAQRSGYAWSWNTTDRFWISDETGLVAVTVDATWIIMPGPHLAPWAVTSSGQPDYEATMYESGDNAVILGWVTAGSGSSLNLRAVVVSPSNTVPQPGALDTIGPLLGFGAIALGWIWFGAVVATRSILHHRAVRGHPRKEPDALGEERDPSLPWRANALWMNARPRIFAVLVAGGLVAWTLGIYEYAFAPHSLTTFVVLDGFVTLMGMIAVVGVYVFLYRPTIPSFIAFSDQGFHVWYDSPYDRELHDGLIPWSGILSVSLVPLPKGGQAWMMKRTDGEIDNLQTLSLENRRALLNAWEIRKPRRPEIGAPPASELFPLEPGPVTLALKRGARFQYFVAVSIFSGGFAAFILSGFLRLNPSDPFYPSRFEGGVIIGSFFLLLLGIHLAGAIWTRTPRTLVADREGIRLSRGARSTKSLPWDQVKEVGCGLKADRALAYFIDVTGSGARQGLHVNSLTYRVSRDDLARIGDAILGFARQQGIHTETYGIEPTPK